MSVSSSNNNNNNITSTTTGNNNNNITSSLTPLLTTNSRQPMRTSLPDESLSDTGSSGFLDEINVSVSQKKRAKAAVRLFQKQKDYKMPFDTDDSQAEKIRTRATTTALTKNNAKALSPHTPTTDEDSNTALTDSDSSLATDIDPADESTCGDIESGIDNSEMSSIQDESSSSSSSSLDKSPDHKNPRTNTFAASNNNNLPSASPLASHSGRYSRRRSSTSSHRSYCSSLLGTIPETGVADKSSQSCITNMSNHSSMYAHEFFDDDDDSDDFFDRDDYDHYHERQHPSAPAPADTASTSENDSDVDVDVYGGKIVRERRESSGNRRMNVILLSIVGCFLVISLAIAVALGIVLHTKHHEPLILENDDYNVNTNSRGNDVSLDAGENSNIFTNDILVDEGGDLLIKSP